MADYNAGQCTIRALPAVCHHSSALRQNDYAIRSHCAAGMPIMQPKLNVTTKQVLADLAFTAGAAFATAGIVSAVAAALILMFAR
jgi:hypothetical protein